MKERLKKLLEYQKLNVYKFETKISVGEGTIRGFLADKNGLRVDTLSKISVVFPEINLDWLITGRGSMFIGENGVPDAVPPPPSEPPSKMADTPANGNEKAVIDILHDTITAKNNQIKEKDCQIKEKDCQIKEKDSQIKEKDSQINRLLTLIEKIQNAPKTSLL